MAHQPFGEEAAHVVQRIVCFFGGQLVVGCGITEMVPEGNLQVHFGVDNGRAEVFVTWDNEELLVFFELR